MIKIDLNSKEFLDELEKTKKFTSKVCNNFGYVYNPNEEINISIQQGLTRNKLIYGKRYCPCFMVIGETKEEQKKADNRVCPCTPGTKIEIPNDGKCHCGIFCTPKHAKELEDEIKLNQITHSHSRKLTQKECNELLEKEQIDSDELEALLEAREIGYIDFKLIDVREEKESNSNKIKGTDFLVPTTSFYETINQLKNEKETNLIVYCNDGNSSSYCHQMMKDLGFKKVSSLEKGLLTFKGKTSKEGEK